MAYTGTVCNLEDVLPLLQNIDAGYEPKEEELLELAQITELKRTYAGTIAELPKSMGLLTGLQKLSLRGLKDDCLTSIISLENLQELDLVSAEITNLKGLSYLRNLRRLHLSGTKITSLDGIEALTNLQDLNLFNTEISSTESLSHLINLQWLNLSQTKVTDLMGLSNLVNLKVLYLNDTNISCIDTLSCLKRLQRLYLRRTHITNLEALECMINLTELDLHGTKIVSVSSLMGLKKLRILDLENTKITTIPFRIRNLTKLRYLNLCGLKLQSIPKTILDLKLPFHLDGNYSGGGILLSNTSISTQPINIFDQPREMIRAYFDEAKIPVNEAKVIFLGDGGAGKTHTVKRIIADGAEGEYITDATMGIYIDEKQVEKKGGGLLNIRFWDFGGQENMHAMHRCFLTGRACYVVVISNRWDLDRQARNWLKTIDSFAKGASVLLAVNKWEGIQSWPMDTTALYRDFSNLVDVVSFSAKTDSQKEFQSFVDRILKEAKKLDSCAMYFPERWETIRCRLQKMGQEKFYITKADYHDICNEMGLHDRRIRGWLLEWFNDLGVCFSYHLDDKKKTELDDYKVLDPQWLTSAIYILINAKKAYARRGQISWEGIVELLSQPELKNRKARDYILKDVRERGYSPEECRYVLEVMRKFRLSYPIEDEEAEFIPALCPNDTPKNLHPTTYMQRLSYEIRYPYMPDTVIQRLMVMRCQHQKLNKLWRRGMRLDDRDHGLCAVVDTSSGNGVLRIDIYAEGDSLMSRQLNGICEDVHTINKELGLQAEEYLIILEQEGELAVPRGMLEAAKDQGREKLPLYSPAIGLRDYWVLRLLGEAFGENETQNAYHPAETEEDRYREMPQLNIHIHNTNNLNNSNQIDLSLIMRLLDQRITNEQVLKQLEDKLIDALKSTDERQAQEIGQELQKEKKQKKSILTRAAELFKNVGAMATATKTIVNVLQELIPQLKEYVPEIVDWVQILLQQLK